MKYCPKCKSEKELTEFSKDKNRADGHYTYCKQCGKEDSKKYYKENKEKLKSNARKWNKIYKKNNLTIAGKKCSKCNTFKNIDQFGKDITRLDGHRSWCKECRNKDKKGTEARKVINTYRKNRYASDPMYRLNHAVRSMIRYSLKGEKNGKKLENVVGFSLIQLKEHLEKQFAYGMSWDNYGKLGWEIDHIIPLSAHNFSSYKHIDFKKAWKLENLRPLWSLDNLLKRDKLSEPFQPSLAMAI